MNVIDTLQQNSTALQGELDKFLQGKNILAGDNAFDLLQLQKRKESAAMYTKTKSVAFIAAAVVVTGIAIYFYFKTRKS